MDLTNVLRFPVASGFLTCWVAHSSSEACLSQWHSVPRLSVWKFGFLWTMTQGSLRRQRGACEGAAYPHLWSPSPGLSPRHAQDDIRGHLRSRLVVILSPLCRLFALGCFQVPCARLAFPEQLWVPAAFALLPEVAVARGFGLAVCFRPRSHTDSCLLPYKWRLSRFTSDWIMTEWCRQLWR